MKTFQALSFIPREFYFLSHLSRYCMFYQIYFHSIAKEVRGCVMIMSLSVLQGIVRHLRSCSWSAWETTSLTTPCVDCSQRSTWSVAWTSKSKRTRFHIDCVSWMQFLSWNQVFHYIFFQSANGQGTARETGFSGPGRPSPQQCRRRGQTLTWRTLLREFGWYELSSTMLDSSPQISQEHVCRKISRSNVFLHFGPLSDLYNTGVHKI